MTIDDVLLLGERAYAAGAILALVMALVTFAKVKGVECILIPIASGLGLFLKQESAATKLAAQLQFEPRLLLVALNVIIITIMCARTSRAS